MDRDKLKATLGNLHHVLGESTEVDDKLRELLVTLDADIHRVLAEQAGGSVPDEVNLSSRAEVAAGRFGAQHPRLEMLLSELADTLSKLGI